MKAKLKSSFLSPLILFVTLSILAVFFVYTETPAIAAKSELAALTVEYTFLHDIGEVVEYNDDWWEITAKLLQRHSEEGIVYPWYRLTRPNDGTIEHVWVWAVRIDWERMENGGDSCCPDPPPKCPDPPC